MDDNAPVHRDHTLDTCEDQNEVTSMEWTAQSPDHNRKYVALREAKMIFCVKSRVCGETSNWII